MSIAAEAASDQIGGSYSADDWQDIVIPVGTVIYAGYHGAPEYGRYFTDRQTILANADGVFGFLLWGVLQVRPHATHGDRQEVREFRVVSPCPAAAGAATRNAKAYWGGSGGFQYFIPDRYHVHLQETRIIPLNTTGLF